MHQYLVLRVMLEHSRVGIPPFLHKHINSAPICGQITFVTNQKLIKYVLHPTSKQNITRDIEIKNIVAIATGEWGGDSGERGL